MMSLTSRGTCENVKPELTTATSWPSGALGTMDLMRMGAVGSDDAHTFVSEDLPMLVLVDE
jgi:hypothetical protein